MTVLFILNDFYFYIVNMISLSYNLAKPRNFFSVETVRSLLRKTLMCAAVPLLSMFLEGTATLPRLLLRYLPWPRNEKNLKCPSKDDIRTMPHI